MRNLKVFHLQKRVAFITAAAGYLVAFINFVNKLDIQGAAASFIKPSVLYVFIISSIFLLTAFIRMRGARIIQVSFLYLMGFISILDVYNSIHGLGLILLSVFLSFKYGYFRRRPLAKIMIYIASVFGMIEVAARLQEGVGDWMTGLDAIVYLVFFLSVTYIIYQDEINAYITAARQAEDEITMLKVERNRLAGMLEELDSRISSLVKTVDLDAAGISPAEKRVLEALVVYRETEAELAARLGISFHTVKNHLRHIRDKLGVDRREEIIDMCRNNFPAPE